MIFEDRQAVARQLAARLAPLAGARPLILAVPRGAVPMGLILAEALDGDLDVVLVRKLRSRWSPELAVGAVDESGRVELRDPEVDPEYLREETARQLATIRERRARYAASSPPVDPAGRTVIVVDDGVATGSTLIAALRSVRAQRPARLIAAAGVAPPDTVDRLRAEADDVVVLDTPEEFFAVSQFFRSFPQVTDDEVTETLRAHAERRRAADSRSE